MYRAALYMFWYSRGIDGKCKDRNPVPMGREASDTVL